MDYGWTGWFCLTPSIVLLVRFARGRLFFFVQEEEAVIRTGSSSRVETEEEFPLMSPHTTPLAKNNRAYVPVLDAPPVAEPRPAARRGRPKQLHLSNKEITVHSLKKSANQGGPEPILAFTWLRLCAPRQLLLCDRAAMLGCATPARCSPRGHPTVSGDFLLRCLAQLFRLRCLGSSCFLAYNGLAVSANIPLPLAVLPTMA
jgi:hypothetical protein